MGVSAIEKNKEPKNIVIPNTINNEVIPDTIGKPTKEEIEELYSYESAICKIKFGTSGSAIGFFCEINDDDIPFKKALLTNNHVLNEKSIDINKEIKFEYCKEEKKISITKNRKVFTKKELDYTCIEIFDTDKINKFFKIDQNIFNNKDSLKNQEIFIMQNPSGELSYDSGKILDIKNDILSHSVSTVKGSSGSPLIKRYNINLIIGMNVGGQDIENSSNKIKYNFAIPFDVIIKDIKDQAFNEFITINLIYEKSKDIDSNNNIFGQKFVENNRENIILKINGLKSELIEKYNLKEGINNIQIILKNNLINLKDMFYGAASLKNIEELKYLNTEEVNDFSGMFSYCSSLSDIKGLQNWNVSNGNNFEGIFMGCPLLSDIKGLQNWNVSNGNNFSYMFKECSSLSNINSLQNWDVSNGINFSEIFFNCYSLSDINALQNWNVSNGNIFTGMFSYCSSLSDIKALQNWNVSNGNNFSKMFGECSSLLDIKGLQNWNVSNGNDFSEMFSGCSSLSNIQSLKNWNVSKGNNFRNMFHGCSSLSDIYELQNWDISINNNFSNIFNE